MSHPPAIFPYLVRQPGLGPAGMAPMLPILLSANKRQVKGHGLVDSGAAVNRRMARDFRLTDIYGVLVKDIIA